MPHEIYYTLTDTAMPLADIAFWVRRRMPKYTASESLFVARQLQKGERWNPSVDEVNEYRDVGPCTLKTIPDPTNPWEVHFAEQEALLALRQRGAEGDAVAAIAYCRADAEGRVSHGAFA